MFEVRGSKFDVRCWMVDVSKFLNVYCPLPIAHCLLPIDY